MHVFHGIAIMELCCYTTQDYNPYVAQNTCISQKKFILLQLRSSFRWQTILDSLLDSHHSALSSGIWIRKCAPVEIEYSPSACFLMFIPGHVFFFTCKVREWYIVPLIFIFLFCCTNFHTSMHTHFTIGFPGQFRKIIIHFRFMCIQIRVFEVVEWRWSIDFMFSTFKFVFRHPN